MIAISLTALALAGCESTGNNVAGTADYDSLKAAHDQCTAQGGQLVLKDLGDPTYIQDYVCKGK